MNRLQALVIVLLFSSIFSGLVWLNRQNLQQENDNLTIQLTTAEAQNSALPTPIPTFTPTSSSTLPPTVTPTPTITSTISITNTAHQLAAEALIQLQNHFDVALLLAVESHRLADTPITRDVLLQVLNHNTQLQAFLPKPANGKVDSLAFSPDGRFLATAHSGGQVMLYDLQKEPFTGQPLSGLPTSSLEKKELTYLYFSPNSQFLVGGYNGKKGVNYNPMVIWGIPPHQLKVGNNQNFDNLAFVSDSIFFVTRQDNLLNLWSLPPGDTPDKQYPLPNANPIINLVPHPLKSQLILVHQDGLLEVWDPFTTNIVNSFIPLPGRELDNLVYHPEGTLLALSSENELVLWDTIAQQKKGTLPTLPIGVGFNQKGNLLLVANLDQSLQLFDVETLQPVSTFLQNGEPLTPLSVIALHPDGDLIAVGDEMGNILLWSVSAKSRLNNLTDSAMPTEDDLVEWRRRACYTVNRNFTEAEWQLYFGNQPYRRTCPQFPRP